jgi:tetratricopeptide (TPR) repeat protein
MGILERAEARESFGTRAVPPRLREHRLVMAGAMAAGAGGTCLSAARAAAEATTLGLLLRGRGAEMFLAGPALALARFGRWRALEAEDSPSPLWPMATALDAMARGLAAVWGGDVEGAHRQHTALVAAQRSLPEGAYAGENDARVIVGIARRLLGGEILARSGELDEGLSMLRAAVEVEDALRVAEPPDWPLHARHLYGAALLDAGRAKEAEAVYVADLAAHPEDGWALWGLAQARVAQGLDDADVRARFDKAWANADSRPVSSRYALPR